MCKHNPREMRMHKIVRMLHDADMALTPSEKLKLLYNYSQYEISMATVKALRKRVKTLSKQLAEDDITYHYRKTLARTD